MAEKHTFQTLDHFASSINGFGRFQKLLTAVLCILYVCQSYHTMIIHFVASQPRWKCVQNSTHCQHGHIHVGHIYPAHDNGSVKIRLVLLSSQTNSSSINKTSAVDARNPLRKKWELWLLNSYHLSRYHKLDNKQTK